MGPKASSSKNGRAAAGSSPRKAGPGSASEPTPTPTRKAGPPRPPRRRLSPEARRAELLTAALAVFATRGLGEARHAEIAEAAGVSVATVFFYFPTREALVAAVLDEVARFLLGMATDVHAGQGPADEVLLAHLRAFTNSVDSSPHHTRVWLDWSTAVREQVWQRYLDFIDRMLAIVRGTLERGQREGSISRASEADDQARLLVGSAHMISLMKFSGAPAEKVEHFVGALLEAVLGRRGT